MACKILRENKTGYVIGCSTETEANKIRQDINEKIHQLDLEWMASKPYNKPKEIDVYWNFINARKIFKTKVLDEVI